MSKDKVLNTKVGAFHPSEMYPRDVKTFSYEPIDPDVAHVQLKLEHEPTTLLEIGVEAEDYLCWNTSLWHREILPQGTQAYKSKYIQHSVAFWLSGEKNCHSDF